jgi:predicted DsbA family dithiol-disulfide isomerase
MDSKPKIMITIVSDVICPWCWVGKRKLEMAMEKVKVEIEL